LSVIRAGLSWRRSARHSRIAGHARKRRIVEQNIHTDGTCLQSLQSIFLVGSDEYDAVFLFGDRPEEGKTVFSRHRNIEEDEINFSSFQKFPSFSG